MQLRAGVGAQPDNIAGIGRNFRLVQNDMNRIAHNVYQLALAIRP